MTPNQLSHTHQGDTFLCLSHLVCGPLLWQPRDTKARTITQELRSLLTLEELFVLFLQLLYTERPTRDDYFIDRETVSQRDEMIYLKLLSYEKFLKERSIEKLTLTLCSPHIQCSGPL